MMGHIIEWFYNGLAGIQPVEPGFRKVRTHPYMPESMNEFICSYQSVQGKITVKAVRKDGKVDVSVEAPEGMEWTLE